MQEISSKVENFSCEVWRNQKNPCTQVKLESKNQTKKVVVERVGGKKVPIERLGSCYVPPIIRPTTPPTLTYTYTHKLERQIAKHAF